ncbi:metal ABC transporter substrate-binding protein [Anaerocolumna chitinilytica]|uniref:ABC transporter substrate-binding protein n=1 Tax=Anaerocolumna chitinilytica TaxID=1727145 RepID=A0A7I8DKP3_9FIRM|nr:ABC transporter substrate-binding protein [Anaerocolumna chitinilytica]
MVIIMKRIICLFTAIMLIAVLTAGCGNKNENNKEPQVSSAETGGEASGDAKNSDTGDKLKVVTSFYAMYDFAEKIGGDKVSVINMVPAGIEPHDWEPAASDITNLEKAQVFIYNGAGMEHWVDTVLDSLSNKELVITEASSGITLQKGHSEEEGTYDPHVWLNPENAKSEMNNIKEAFIKADPNNEANYSENYETYAAKLDALDKKYKETLTALENKDIIVAHEAFGYLCNAYGLNQVGIEGLSPDSEPDPSKMEETIQFAKDNKVKVIFFEELVSPKVAETIAKEVGVKTDVLNPLEGLSEDDIKAGGDYFSVMETNLTSLAEALK